MFNKISFKKRTIDLVIIGGFLYSIFWKKTSGLYLCFIMTECKWHGVKVGPGPQGPRTRDLRTIVPGTRDTPQSLKVGPQDPLQNVKVGPQDSLRSLKVGPLHLSLMNSFFFRIFHRFFFTYLFLSFLNKIQRNINFE